MEPPFIPPQKTGTYCLDRHSLLVIFFSFHMQLNENIPENLISVTFITMT